MHRYCSGLLPCCYTRCKGTPRRSEEPRHGIYPEPHLRNCVHRVTDFAISKKLFKRFTYVLFTYFYDLRTFLRMDKRFAIREIVYVKYVKYIKNTNRNSEICKKIRKSFDTMFNKVYTLCTSFKKSYCYKPYNHHETVNKEGERL